MNILLVRHAESLHDYGYIHQTDDTPLSPHGVSQAEALAADLTSVKIDAILSSPFTRARQTAEIVSQSTNRTVETIDLLRELKAPSDLYGKRVDQPEVLDIRRTVREHELESEWHWGDEENFAERRLRAVTILDFLIQRNHQNIVVVTHAALIQMLLSVLTFGDEVSPTTHSQMAKTFRVDNAVVSLIEFRETVWRVHCWNGKNLGDTKVLF